MKIFYRPEIDGLRAIAVFAVVLYHAQITVLGHQPFKGGFIGVDIFFVISGYLITSIILKELIATGSFSFKYFYERRVRRILPALLLIMLVSLPFAWMYLIPSHFENFSWSILYSLGFSSNFYFYNSGQEYGAIDGLLKPFLHTWSLSVEEQFYILFPIALLFTFKYFRKYLIHILILGFIISLGLAEWGSRNYPRFNFYVLPTRGWELLAGSMLAYLEITLGHRSKHKILNLILPSAGFILIGYSIFFFNDEMFHPSFYTLSPIIGVCLIIWFSQKDEIITKLLSTKLFVGVGLISYSLYLWHYPIFAFARIKDFTFSNNSKFECIVLILVLSILSYLFLEKPFRNKLISFSKISLILISSAFLIILFNISIIYYEGVKLKSRIHPFLWKYDNERKNLKLSFNYKNFDHRKNVFIVGNSYSDDLLNLFNNNKNLNKEYYFYVAKSENDEERMQFECFYFFLKENNQKCQRGNFTLLKEQYDKSDYIIFHFRRNWYYLTSWFPEITQFLMDDKKRFIVLLDDVSGAGILDTYLMTNNKLPLNNELIELEKLFYNLAQIWDKQSFDKAKKILDENDIKYLARSKLYCDYDKKRCPLIINGDKIYSDEGHLTNNGAKYFSNQGKKIINRLIN